MRSPLRCSRSTRSPTNQKMMWLLKTSQVPLNKIMKKVDIVMVYWYDLDEPEGAPAASAVLEEPTTRTGEKPIIYEFEKDKRLRRILKSIGVPAPIIHAVASGHRADVHLCPSDGWAQAKSITRMPGGLNSEYDAAKVPVSNAAGDIIG